MLKLYNVNMKLLNVKKNKETIECDKSIVTYGVESTQCEDEIVKCEKKNKETTKCDKRTVICDVRIA